MDMSLHLAYSCTGATEQLPSNYTFIMLSCTICCQTRFTRASRAYVLSWQFSPAALRLVCVTGSGACVCPQLRSYVFFTSKPYHDVRVLRVPSVWI
eukprot:15481615-Alexandrium_andersonii.AAC.1